jgi:hypothetical protein
LSEAPRATSGRRSAARHLRQAVRIEQHGLLRQLAQRAHHALGVEATIAHCGLLAGGEDAARGGDQQGAVWRNEAAFAAASRLDEFGRDHHIHVAG